MRGYGIYIWLTQLCNDSPTRKIEYNPGIFAWEIHEEEGIIRRVAENYGLFNIDAGFISDAYSNTLEAKEERRKEKVYKSRCEAAKRAAVTRKKKREKDSVKSQVEYSAVSVEDDFMYDDISEFEVRYERVKESWNAIFKELGLVKRQEHRLSMNLDSLTRENLLKTFSAYSDKEIVEAFAQASKSQFPWLFKDVVKQDNIQRLLCESEHSTNNTNLSSEQREILNATDSKW